MTGNRCDIFGGDDDGGIGGRSERTPLTAAQYLVILSVVLNLGGRGGSEGRVIAAASFSFQPSSSSSLDADGTQRVVPEAMGNNSNNNNSMTSKSRKASSLSSSLVHALTSATNDTSQAI